MNNNINIFDEIIFNKFEKKCDIDIFDNSFNYLINFIIKHIKIFFIITIIILYAIIRKINKS